MTIAKRIERLETLIQHTDQSPSLLREPADPQADADFSRQVAAAVATGAPVIVLTAGDAPRTRLPGEAAIFNNEFLCTLEVAARTGDREHGNALQAIVAQAQGNALPVAATLGG